MRIYGHEIDLNSKGKVIGAWGTKYNGQEGYGIPYRKCWRYSYGKRYDDGWDNAWGKYTPAQVRRKMANGTLYFF